MAENNNSNKKGKSQFKGKPKRGKSFRKQGGNGANKSHFKYKKAEMKFSPLDSRYAAPQATYATVKEHLLNKILKEFEKGAKDVADSLEAETETTFTEPVLQVSTSTDAAVREREDRTHGYVFTEELKRFNNRQENYKDGCHRAYGLIWSDYMSITMQNRIEQHPAYLTTIKGNAIELLKAIKASMHEAIRAQKPALTMLQALTKWLTFKQGDGVTLAQYIKQFKEHRDVVKTQLGESMFDYFIEQQAEYRRASQVEKDALKKAMFEQVTGMLFLLNSDQRKYGSITQDLAGSFTRGRDEYPTTLTKAIDVLDTHVIDKTYKDHKKNQAKQKKDDKSGKTEASFAQKKSDTKCYCCGDPAHKSPDCPWKDKIPMGEWFRKTHKVPKQAQKSFAQSEDSDNESDDEEDNESIASTRSDSDRCQS
jgi:hypothetical protein